MTEEKAKEKAKELFEKEKDFAMYTTSEIIDFLQKKGVNISSIETELNDYIYKNIMAVLMMDKIFTTTLV